MGLARDAFALVVPTRGPRNTQEGPRRCTGVSQGVPRICLRETGALEKPKPKKFWLNPSLQNSMLCWDTIALCTDWANISAKNRAKSRLNYPLWTKATCKALLGDLESTLKRLTYIKKLVGIFIFPWHLWRHGCLVLGRKNFKMPGILRLANISLVITLGTSIDLWSKPPTHWNLFKIVHWVLKAWWNLREISATFGTV